jgi:hypothetical protein
MPDPVTLGNWNFREKRLAHEIGKTGGEFVTSESVLLLVTPIAQYGPEALDRAVAVALTQDIGIQQQPQVIQINEVGSNRKYTLRSGRVQSGMSLSRALFDGENLIKALSPGTEVSDEAFYDHPGHDNFMINMASSVFSRPFGLGMIFRDLQNNSVGGFFCEETFLQSHSMQTSANSPLVMESIQLVWNALLPIRSTV